MNALLLEAKDNQTHNTSKTTRPKRDESDALKQRVTEARARTAEATQMVEQQERMLALLVKQQQRTLALARKNEARALKDQRAAEASLAAAGGENTGTRYIYYDI